ncbi:hypothetical protein B0H11DRAFT_1912239 [Mycena galericulata]|nr:hypothetical protein B0H11DRAFT_2232534 [Mycena galericulata]KAJ7490229.1 hypothetical protein B0H11DRAFT_1912239 [Mycena galericulata]
MAHVDPKAKYIEPDMAATHVTKTIDYYVGAVDASVDGRTAPIFVPAVFSAGGKPLCCVDPRVGRRLAGFAAEDISVQYDALEYMQWNWEFSLGSLYRGAFNHIPPLPPPQARIASRHYDAVTQLWAHPFSGRFAERAVAIQLAPLLGKEIADVLRSYSINGGRCSPGSSFMAPDCFAPTLLCASEVRSRVWDYTIGDAKYIRADGTVFYKAEDGSYRRPFADKVVVLHQEDVFRSKVWV